MRRMTAVMISGTMLLAIGCSGSYDIRMGKTLEKMKYEKRLNDNLQPPPSEGPLKEYDIYVRAPKPFESAKEFLGGNIQPGLFDVERSYYEGDKAFLHILARKKTAKKAPAKGAPAEQQPAAARGAFNADVLSVLKAKFGDDENIALEKVKDNPEKSVLNKRLTFPSADKQVEVYFLKAEPYDVAMVFEFKTAERAALASKLKLCLESFAVGPKAHNKYAGASGDEEAEAAGSGVTF